jgi:hypothetical protein
MTVSKTIENPEMQFAQQALHLMSVTVMLVTSLKRLLDPHYRYAINREYEKE